LILDLKQRRARRSISDLFAGAAASIVVVKEKRVSKGKNRDKNEGMMSRVYRMWWKDQEGKNCKNLSALGWSLGDLVCRCHLKDSSTGSLKLGLTKSTDFIQDGDVSP
jgi:hypothetical protein